MQFSALVGRGHPAHRTLGVADRLRRSFRVIGAAVASTVLVTMIMAALLLERYHPQVEATTAATKALRSDHEAMLDQETHLRGYLLSGDPAFLDAAAANRHDIGAGATDIARAAAGSPDLIALVLERHVAAQRWLGEWADVAPDHVAAADMSRFILAGRRLFEEYRSANDRLLNQVVARRDGALRSEGRVLLHGMIAQLAIGGVLFLVAGRQHRRLRRETVAPVEALLEAMRRIRDGDVRGAIAVKGPRELVQIGEGLQEVTESIAAHRRVADEHASEVARQADKLSLLLELAREIAGSLSLRYVCDAVSVAATRVSGFDRVVVWLVDDDPARLVPLFDSTQPKGDPPAIDPSGVGGALVVEAAHGGRTTHDGVRPRRGEEVGPVLVNELAIPMVVGARVVGVLQFDDAAGRAMLLPAADLEVLETLAIHAAAAIEAARLHHNAEEQAQIDALTRLHNRRRLDADLHAECDRSARYERPVAVVMVDVDQFKGFNDRHGHQHGDEVLQQVAAVLQEGIRTSDTAYRYGGEEFVLLLRETTSAGAVELAERLRLAVRDRTSDLLEPVTASFGVASLPEDGSNAVDLLAAADRAMYEAKRTGRNRVVVATSKHPIVV